MKIVVLDGFTLNPGDLSWEALESLGLCEIYERTPPVDLARRAAHAEILLTNKTDWSGLVIQTRNWFQRLHAMPSGTLMTR